MITSNVSDNTESYDHQIKSEVSKNEIFNNHIAYTLDLKNNNLIASSRSRNAQKISTEPTIERNIKARCSPRCVGGAVDCCGGMFVCPGGSNDTLLCLTSDSYTAPICFGMDGVIRSGMCTGVDEYPVCTNGAADCGPDRVFRCPGMEDFTLCLTGDNDAEPICFNDQEKLIRSGMCFSNSSTTSSSTSGAAPPQQRLADLDDNKDIDINDVLLAIEKLRKQSRHTPSRFENVFVDNILSSHDIESIRLFDFERYDFAGPGGFVILPLNGDFNDPSTNIEDRIKHLEERLLIAKHRRSDLIKLFESILLQDTSRPIDLVPGINNESPSAVFQELMKVESFIQFIYSSLVFWNMLSERQAFINTNSRAMIALRRIKDLEALESSLITQVPLNIIISDIDNEDELQVNLELINDKVELIKLAFNSGSNLTQGRNIKNSVVLIPPAETANPLNPYTRLAAIDFILNIHKKRLEFGRINTSNTPASQGEFFGLLLPLIPGRNADRNNTDLQKAVEYATTLREEYLFWHQILSCNKTPEDQTELTPLLRDIVTLETVLYHLILGVNYNGPGVDGLDITNIDEVKISLESAQNSLLLATCGSTRRSGDISDSWHTQDLAVLSEAMKGRKALTPIEFGAADLTLNKKLDYIDILYLEDLGTEDYLTRNGLGSIFPLPLSGDYIDPELDINKRIQELELLKYVTKFRKSHIESHYTALLIGTEVRPYKSINGLNQATPAEVFYEHQKVKMLLGFLRSFTDFWIQIEDMQSVINNNLRLSFLLRRIKDLEALATAIILENPLDTTISDMDNEDIFQVITELYSDKEELLNTLFSNNNSSNRKAQVSMVDFNPKLTVVPVPHAQKWNPFNPYTKLSQTEDLVNISKFYLQFGRVLHTVDLRNSGYDEYYYDGIPLPLFPGTNYNGNSEETIIEDNAKYIIELRDVNRFWKQVYSCNKRPETNQALLPKIERIQNIETLLLSLIIGADYDGPAIPNIDHNDKEELKIKLEEKRDEFLPLVCGMTPPPTQCPICDCSILPNENCICRPSLSANGCKCSSKVCLTTPEINNSTSSSSSSSSSTSGNPTCCQCPIENTAALCSSDNVREMTCPDPVYQYPFCIGTTIGCCNSPNAMSLDDCRSDVLHVNCGGQNTTSGNPFECAIEGNSFMTDGGGCRDLITGIIWAGPFYDDHDDASENCSVGLDGWELPSPGDITLAGDHNASSHLNFKRDEAPIPTSKSYFLTDHVANGFATAENFSGVFRTKSTFENNFYFCKKAPTMDGVSSTSSSSSSTSSSSSSSGGNTTSSSSSSGSTTSSTSSTSGSPSDKCLDFEYKEVTSEAGKIAVADFNGDGISDIATDNRGNVRIRLGLGNGKLSEEDVIFGSSLDSTTLVAGDINGDGNIDLVSSTVNNGLLIYNGVGDGRFFNSYMISSIGGNGVHITDLNNDNLNDIIVTKVGLSGDFSVLINNNGISFTEQVYTTTKDVNGIVSADFNNDGNVDLAFRKFRVTDYFDVQIYLGDGNGGLTEGNSINARAGINDIKTGDFNRDGLDDIAVALDGLSSKIGVLLSNGDGTLSPTVELEIPRTSEENNNNLSFTTNSLIVHDFNCDSKLDILLRNGHSMAISPSSPAPEISASTNIFTGDGNGSFTVNTERFLIGAPIIEFELARSNNDNRADFIFRSGGLANLSGEDSALHSLVGIGNCCLGDINNPLVCGEESASFMTQEVGCKDLASNLTWAGPFNDDFNTALAFCRNKFGNNWSLPSFDNFADSTENGAASHLNFTDIVTANTQYLTNMSANGMVNTLSFTNLTSHVNIDQEIPFFCVKDPSNSTSSTSSSSSSGGSTTTSSSSSGGGSTSSTSSSSSSGGSTTTSSSSSSGSTNNGRITGPVIDTKHLHVEIDDNVTMASLGDTLTYVIDITNTSDEDLTNISVFNVASEVGTVTSTGSPLDNGEIYSLDRSSQTFGFNQTGNSEKWFKKIDGRANNHWFYILPNQELYEQVGSTFRLEGDFRGVLENGTYESPHQLIEDEQVVYWEIDLPKGQSKTLTFNLRLDSPTPNDTRIINKLFIERGLAKENNTILSTANTTSGGSCNSTDAMTNNPGACAIEDHRYTTTEGGCKDHEGNLVWSSSTNIEGRLNWEYAKIYCENLDEGGFCDWRLPNIGEFTISSEGGRNHFNLIPFYYWTSEESVNDSEDAHSYRFFHEHPNGHGEYWKEYRHAVICVRSGEPVAACTPIMGVQPRGACSTEDSEFETANGGCKDLNSEVVWSALSEDSVIWSEGFDYCNDLMEGGYCDWRLPTLKDYEISDTRDYKRLESHLNNFTDRFHDIAWTADEKNPDYAITYRPTEDSTSLPYFAPHKIQTQHKVLCIRDDHATCDPLPLGEDPPGKCTTESSEFKTHRGGCTDNKYGITWSKASDTNKLWTDAISYCEDLSEGGACDWRLPTPYELELLNENNRAAPSDLMAGSVWSVAKNNGATAIGINLHNGAREIEQISDLAHKKAICVRGESIDVRQDQDTGFYCTSIKSLYPEGECKINDNLFRTENGGCKLLRNNIIFSDKRNTSSLGNTWLEASEACRLLESGGYCDWRLPTAQELIQASQAGGTQHINTDNSSRPYWTSSENQAVYLSTGTLNSWTPNTKQFFVCARDENTRIIGEDEVGSCVADNSRFKSQNGGCHDITSNLIWSNEAINDSPSINGSPPLQANYSNSISYCLNLMQGGFDDWRLPEINELLTISSSTYYEGRLHVTDWYHWSATEYPNRAKHAFAVNFGAGMGSEMKTKGAIYKVVCVRDGSQEDIPHLTSISPNTGNGDTTVTLTGGNLQNITMVEFRQNVDGAPIGTQMQRYATILSKSNTMIIVKPPKGLFNHYNINSGATITLTNSNGFNYRQENLLFHISPFDTNGNPIHDPVVCDTGEQNGASCTHHGECCSFYCNPSTSMCENETVNCANLEWDSTNAGVTDGYQAIKKCTLQDVDSKNDWRLPNINEFAKCGKTRLTNGSTYWTDTAAYAADGAIGTSATDRRVYDITLEDDLFPNVVRRGSGYLAVPKCVREINTSFNRKGLDCNSLEQANNGTGFRLREGGSNLQSLFAKCNDLYSTDGRDDWRVATTDEIKNCFPPSSVDDNSVNITVGAGGIDVVPEEYTGYDDKGTFYIIPENINFSGYNSGNGITTVSPSPCVRNKLSP